MPRLRSDGERKNVILIITKDNEGRRRRRGEEGGTKEGVMRALITVSNRKATNFTSAALRVSLPGFFPN